MDPRSRVVVTGAAAFSCCGFGAEAFWRLLQAGTTVKGNVGGGALRRFNPPEIAPGNDPKVKSDHPLAARLLAAIEHDLGQFLKGLKPEEKECAGVALGTAYAHLVSYLSYYQTGTEQGYQFVNPRHFPSTLPNFCTCEVNNAYSLWGSSTTVVSGLTAGLEAIGYAAAAIERGEETAILAGGLDEINDYNQKALEVAGLRSPSGFIRPFAADRDGAVPGEGLAVLLLQAEKGARRTGQRPLAEICGFASAHGIHWNDPSAPFRAAKTVRQALTAAGLDSNDVDAVFPSANGSVEGDEFEFALLREVFDKELPSILLCPIKTATGECFAAAGALQSLGAVYAVGLAPEGPSSAISVSFNGTELRLAERINRRSTALVYSSGYDGTFSALVVCGPAT